MRIISRIIFTLTFITVSLSLFMNKNLFQVILPALGGIYLVLGGLFLNPTGLTVRFNNEMFLFGYTNALSLGSIYASMKESTLSIPTALSAIIILFVVVLSLMLPSNKQWKTYMELIICSGALFILVVISLIIH